MRSAARIGRSRSHWRTGSVTLRLRGAPLNVRLPTSEGSTAYPRGDLCSMDMTTPHRVVVIGSGFGGLFGTQALKRRKDVEITEPK